MGPHRVHKSRDAIERLDRGGRLDWFDSPEIVIEAAIALAALHIFIVHSMTSERPFLDPTLLRERNFAFGLVIILVMGMLSYTPMVLFPPLLQDLRGYPDSVVGTLLAARYFFVLPITLLGLSCASFLAALGL